MKSTTRRVSYLYIFHDQASTHLELGVSDCPPTPADDRAIDAGRLQVVVSVEHRPMLVNSSGNCVSIAESPLVPAGDDLFHCPPSEADQHKE